MSASLTSATWDCMLWMPEMGWTTNTGGGRCECCISSSLILPTWWYVRTMQAIWKPLPNPRARAHGVLSSGTTARSGIWLASTRSRLSSCHDRCHRRSPMQRCTTVWHDAGAARTLLGSRRLGTVGMVPMRTARTSANRQLTHRAM